MTPAAAEAWRTNIGAAERATQFSVRPADECAALDALPDHIRLLLRQHIYNFSAKQTADLVTQHGEAFVARRLTITGRGAYKMVRGAPGDLVRLIPQHGKWVAEFAAPDAPDLAALMTRGLCGWQRCVPRRARAGGSGLVKAHHMEALRPAVSSCLWCDRRFAVKRQGGHDKRFCSSRCRNTCGSAARRYAVALLEAGQITASDLKTPQRSEHASAGSFGS